MSNPCPEHAHNTHSNMNTISKCAESDDKKLAMYAAMKRCSCCAENRMLRDKLEEHEQTISKLMSFVEAIMSKQELRTLELATLLQSVGLDVQEEEVSNEPPEQSQDDDDDSFEFSDFEFVQWEAPCTCSRMSVPITPSQHSSDSELDFY
ncbi:uncharacterized protein LOC117589714 [Drosophila guanche]|uniref:Uncharacterized protein n=1 Tax=Drosophila guanche TaxID=7266 RepID=A0A3B0K3U8_DROGU|nr:uncharacterized protein LOC117589714 [Drosophila guanche]SPP87953.1 Hypothetical predicted protein [Drosophila guanche]